MFVRTWMTTDPVVADPGESLPVAYARMREKHIRRLPVMEDDRLIGVVTLTDLQKLLFEGGDEDAVPTLSSYTVRHVMTGSPLAVAPGDAIESAALLMRRNKISSLPVLDDGSLVGIITETDVFEAFVTIMGLQEDGTRIVMEVEDGGSGIQSVLDAIEIHELDLLSVVTLGSHSKTHSLVTLRVKGPGFEALSEEIRQSGHRVLEIV